MPEAIPNPHRYRAARRLLEQLDRHPPATRLGERTADLANPVQRLQSAINRWTICNQRRWQAASNASIQQVRRLIEQIQTTSTNLDRDIRQHDKPAVTHRGLLDDLDELELEFSDVRYTPDTICVVTDSIVLDDLKLGRFEIRLRYAVITDPTFTSHCQIIALEPRAAGSDSSVTHPHVQDQILCTGDADEAIHQALFDGRICDCFVLIRSVLQTYNPSSAYVRLDEWDGIVCRGCDEVVSDEGCYSCTDCDVDRCLDCIVFCKTCDEPFCIGCVSSCSGCDRLLCDRCMQICPSCSESNCDACLESNHNHDQEQSDETTSESHETDGAPESADAAVCA